MLYLALVASAVLVGLDQFTKWLAIQYISPVNAISVISFNGREVLNLTYLQNIGAAFSILEGKQAFLIIVPCAFLFFILYLLFSRRINDNFTIWAACLILAGGTGNLIDRIAKGYVVDFIDFRIIRFAVFNVADVCAVIGAIMFIIAVIIDDRKKQKAALVGKK